MARSRGRPVKPMPIHPERVISRAVKAGLSATIELQRNISNKNTMKYYDRSSERWNIRQEVYQITKKQGKPDFSYISKAEAPIRNDARLIFYEKAAKYGFTEVSRQKNSDDTVDSLNQRFNVCGAVVRENSEIMFPHPDPVDFGTYTRRDGKGRKKFRRAGYEGSSFGPKVILAHPDLPSLDFGDAVRSHNEYLATFCAIHAVPVRETTKYSHLFYLLTRPYLEFLYSEFKYGKANFQKGVNWALRQVKELILEAGYQPTMYEKRTVTKGLEFSQGEVDKRFFKQHQSEAREFYGDHPAVAELGRLRGKLGDDEDSTEEKSGSSEGPKEKDDDTIFTVNDIEYIRDEVAKRARVAGSIIHRRIADLFPSPWRLNDVVLGGDNYARTSDYIIISEMPLQTLHGAGKVDLILCERTISDDGKRAFWKPVFVLEIKTRLGQSWYVDANYKESEVRPDGSHLQRIVSDFPLSDYPLSDGLWDAIVKSTPTPTARKQLDIYCQALSESYENTTQQILGHVLKGVLVIEASSDITEIRSMIERLLVHAYESVKSRSNKLKRTVFTPPDSDSSRIALVLDEQPALRRRDDEIIQAPWNPVYTPFKAKKESKRKFLLYLAGHSPTSAGQSAAWNARYYHGLQMLHDMKKAQENTEFIWVDLADQFNEPRLAEARLRLRPRGYSVEEIAKVQPAIIREFFESIKIKGYLNDILSFLYKGGEVPSFEQRTRKNKRKVIIVTGADTLRDATPTSHKEQFSTLLDHLMSNLPNDEKTTIVWFDAPVPSVEKAIPYSSRALLPYYETSVLGDVVTEIIWNLPVAPKGAVQPDKWGLPIIGNAPMNDDIRVIVRHSPSEFHMELTHVPFLRGWSKRFRNKGTGRVTRLQEIDDIVPEKSVRDRMKLMSLTILPWLMKLCPDKLLFENSKETFGEQVIELEQEFRGGTKPLDFTKTVLKDPLCRPPSLLDLVKFRLPPATDAKSYQEMTVGKINSQRLYRSPRKLLTKPLQNIPAIPISIDDETVEEELEQEWLFGIKFESDEEDIQSWWMVIQDPAHPSRMLVGCFMNRPLDKDGFLWAENKQEILTQASLDEILGFSQTTMIGRKNGEGLELWFSRDGEEAVFTGFFELRGQGRSTIGHLRNMRQTLTEEPKIRPLSTTQPPESFYKRMVESLQRQLVTSTSPTPVKIQLEKTQDACRVILEDDEGEVLQDITIEYTADLVSLLRWPIAKGGPMFIDSGEYVIWNIFDDIDFGNFDFIRPYITYTAARTAPAKLPKRVAQFFTEAESLQVTIEHDVSVCPLALGDGVDHGPCWRINLPPDCPTQVRKQLERALTGEEVNGLLAPGKIFVGNLYTFEFTLPTVSEKNESIVFHEERYIRIFLRQKGLHLKRLVPGTYLGIEMQQWVVSVEWADPYIKWKAQSTVSGLPFKGYNQMIELIYVHGAQKECTRLVSFITSQIQPDHIVNYPQMKEQVLIGLENRGYSSTSPKCVLRFIKQTETICEYGIFLSDDSHSNPLIKYAIDTTETNGPDSVNDEISRWRVSEELSKYNIANRDAFVESITAWVNEYVPEVEEYSEGFVGWTVTLSVDVRTGEIHWVAEQDGGGQSETGGIVLDPRELKELEQGAACGEVRRIFNLEVVPQLMAIDNLDNVLEEQIPDMVRSIRHGK